MTGLKCSLAALVVVAGCTTASFESTWRAPSAPELTNVVALSPAPDGARRRSVEDRLAHQLSAHGVHAVPGYTVLTPKDRDDREAMIAKLRNDGFDGVVTMRFVGAHQRLEYYPAFDAYWGYAWGPYWGTVVPETVVRVEVNAYSLATKQLVWSAMSRSVDPSDSAQAIGDVSHLVAERLAHDRVIGTAQAMR
ncbi:MAG TPA: hypothetical protein VGG74_04645 [Kofleriaceae bacterium]|jgi:hypothetical protein